MPARQCVAVVILIVVALLLRTSNGQKPCGPGKGECIEVHKCMVARASIMMYGTHSLSRCGWNRLVEKVCCTDNLDTDGGIVTSTSSEEDISVWPGDDKTNNIIPTTESITVQSSTITVNESRGAIRKSEVACERYMNAASSSFDVHILGGEVAKLGEFPHMVVLGYPDANSEAGVLAWNCGGSLISERCVLTAAHCVLRTRPVTARVGAHNLTDVTANQVDYTIEDITLHPEYTRRSGRNDIAVIRVARTIVFNNFVYPACLYTSSDDPLGLIITGWGKISLGRDERSDVLLKAVVSPVPLATCNTTYVRALNRPLDNGQICAAAANPEAPTDSCQGDSGGPLQVRARKDLYKIVGIVSFGLSDCGGVAPSVYARVYHYLDWIEGIAWP